MKNKILLSAALVASINFSNAQEEDKFQWLEDVDSKKSLEWVEAQNKATFDVLSKQPIYQSVYDKSLEVYNSTDRIAAPSIYGKYIYNSFTAP